MNRTGTRDIPADAPVGFIRKRWAEYVFGPEDVDLQFYEVFVMAPLKNARRSGDVSVADSRQFRNFEEPLLPKTDFRERRSERPLLFLTLPPPKRILPSRSILCEPHSTRQQRLLALGNFRTLS